MHYSFSELKKKGIRGRQTNKQNSTKTTLIETNLRENTDQTWGSGSNSTLIHIAQVSGSSWILPVPSRTQLPWDAARDLLADTDSSHNCPVPGALQSQRLPKLLSGRDRQIPAFWANGHTQLPHLARGTGKKYLCFLYTYSPNLCPTNVGGEFSTNF